jgi:hypothetical protein
MRVRFQVEVDGRQFTVDSADQKRRSNRESREQRAESREQRAESREQRAESREQRAENPTVKSVLPLHRNGSQGYGA